MSKRTLTIDPAGRPLEWEGWGACLSWWANTNLGLRQDLADAFFGSGEAVEVEVDGGPNVTVPALGLTIARYNVGGSTWPAEGEQMFQMREGTEHHIPPRKLIEGYRPADGSAFDPNADESQRAMLLMAKAAGATTFELFSVSPLWWMTESRSPAGAVRADEDNLRPGSRQDHCRYLADVAGHARDVWGIDFQSIEPFNEPVSEFWHRDGRQEGCRMSVGAQEAVLRMLRQELDERGLTGTLIAASDENTYAEATDTWAGLSPAVRNVVGRVNVHGYAHDHDDPRTRQRLREAVGDDRAIWQSEVGDGAPHGLRMAYDIQLDITHLKASAWCIWQPVEGEGWGLLDGEFDDTPVERQIKAEGAVKGVNNRYYVLAQYSRHIRPRMRILQTGDQGTIAAYDAGRRRLVLVSANVEIATDRITYDLSRFSRAEGAGGQQAVRVWVTDAKTDERRPPSEAVAAGRRYAREPDATVLDRFLTVHHGPQSITTLEIDNVEL